jgi:hypothetical protein
MRQRVNSCRAPTPLLSGSGVVVVNAPDDAVVLRPRVPTEEVADVSAAVAEALRFPLEGPPLERSCGTRRE